MTYAFSTGLYFIDNLWLATWSSARPREGWRKWLNAFPWIRMTVVLYSGMLLYVFRCKNSDVADETDTFILREGVGSNLYPLCSLFQVRTKRAAFELEPSPNRNLKKHIQTVHTYCAYRLCIQTVHADCAYRLCIQTVHTDCACRLCMQTVRTDCACRLCMQMVHADCAYRLCIQTVHTRWY